LNTINCIIVEDDLDFVAYFKSQLSKFPFLSLIDHCKSYGEALLTLSEKKVDLVFLDIYLNSEDGLNGFDLLRLHSNLPPVIVITNAPDLAVESYHIGIAKDFLVKPFDDQRLLLAINRSIMNKGIINTIMDANSLFLKKGRMLQKFDINQILYFEGYGIYSKLVDHSGAHILNDSLTKIESILDSFKFMRIHKSYIVNLEKITGFNSSKIFIGNNEIPIGISYKAKLENLFRLYEFD